MEEILASLRRSIVADYSLNQDIHTSSKNTLLRKTVKKRHSIFSFSRDALKSDKMLDEVDPTYKQDCKDNDKPSWNPFLSLRGSRGIKKKPKKSTIFNSESSPLRKSGTSITAHPFAQEPGALTFEVCVEFGRRNATRRKSLQDLIGTVGGRFSRRNRHDTTGSILPWQEGLFPGQDLNTDQIMLPLVSIDPEIYFPPTFCRVSGNSSLQKESQNVPAENDELRAKVNYSQDHSHYSQASGPLEFQPGINNHDWNHTYIHKNRQIRDSTSHTSDTLEVSQPSRLLETLRVLEMQKLSQDFKEASRPLSLETPHPVISINFLQNINPAFPLHVRFLEQREPSQYRYSEKFEANTRLLQKLHFNTSFPGKVANKEGTCNSLCHVPQGDIRPSKSASIENSVTLAEKPSDDLQLCISRRRWSMNSSETSRDDVIEGSRKQNEKEFWELERGRNILNEEKQMSCRLLSDLDLDTGPIHFSLDRRVSDSVDESYVSQEDTEVPWPGSEREGPNFVNLYHDSDDIGETPDFAIDSATARQRIGSFLFSTKLLQCCQLPSPENPALVDTVVSKLKEIQLEKAEPVKTWAELGRDFLDRYAPDNELTRTERGRVAVREVLQRCQNIRSRSNKSETSNDETFKISSPHSFEHVYEWCRDRESSGDVTFDHAQDVVQYEWAREERLKARNVPQRKTEQFQDINDYPSDPAELETGAEQPIELSQEFYSSWVESELIREQLFQKPSEPLDEFVVTPSSYGRDWIGELPVKLFGSGEVNAVGMLSGGFPVCPWTSLDCEDDGFERQQGRNTIGKNKITKSESLKSDDTGMTIAMGFKFTQYAKQLEDIFHDALGERTAKHRHRDLWEGRMKDHEYMQSDKVLASCPPNAPRSEADTEISEDFGLKLERYGHSTEEENLQNSP